MKKILLSLLIIPNLAFADPISSMLKQSEIGKVETVFNEVIQEYQSEVLKVSKNENLYEAATLKTEKDARVHAILIDGSKFMVGENSEIQLNQFLLSQSKSVGELTVLKGAFRMISGEINKVEGGNLTINTPLATIGIRGTDFWGLQNSDALTLALIDNGTIDVTSKTGQNVTMDDSMTFITINTEGTISRVQELPLEVLAEAAKTVSLPEDK